MKCSECDSLILEFPTINEEGKTEQRYFHTETIKKCSLKQDGVQINIVDERQNNLYNELIRQDIKEKGVDTPKTETNTPISVVNEEKVSNDDVIKERLCDGYISLNEYDEIKKRIEN